MRTFFLSAGHGGSDPGATAHGTTERDETIALVDQAVVLLRPQDLGGTQLVVVPHQFALREAVRFVNGQFTNPWHDLCLEVHLNSNAGPPGTGTETYYGDITLAQEIHGEVVRHLGLRDRKVKDGRGFYWNRMTRPASALLEMGFINNAEDLAAVRARGPEALARAVVRASGGTWIEARSLPPPTPLTAAPAPQPPGTDKDAIRTLISQIRTICERIEQLLG